MPVVMGINTMPKPTFFNLPDAKRQAIIDIAIDEFAETDYEVASISKIVAKAGIAKGSFYQYFDDKADLFMHLLNEGAQRKSAFLANNPPPDPQMGLFAYLRWLFKTGLHFDFINPKITKVAQRAMSGNGPFPEAMLRQMRAQTMVYFRDLLQKAVDDGQLRSDLDVASAAFVFYAVFNELSEYITRQLNIPDEETNPMRYLLNHEAEAEAVFDNVLRIIEMGVGH